MAIQVTIIGLGQIGASIGMALSAHTEKIYRVGHDRQFNVERAAQHKGAVDKAEHNLPNAVRDAQLVILALPVTEIRETLGFISQDLQSGAVILDTAPVKAEVTKWAEELLPKGCYYIGVVPAPAVQSSLDEKTGLDSARPDLFSNRSFLVSAPAGTPGEAVQLASNFIQYLNATPILTEQIESDGLMASAHILPQLVSAALWSATADQPGSTDARKMSGHVYAAATSAVNFDDANALSLLSLHNSKNVTRVLDSMIAALQDLRDDIENGDETSLKKNLSAARAGRESWKNESTAPDLGGKQKESINFPSLSEQLLGSLMGKKSKK